MGFTGSVGLIDFSSRAPGPRLTARWVAAEVWRIEGRGEGKQFTAGFRFEGFRRTPNAKPQSLNPKPGFRVWGWFRV